MTARRPFVAMFLGLLSTGCVSSPRGAATSGAQAGVRTYGSFKVASDALENPAVTVTSCRSGERLSFFGVDLFDDTARMAVRLVIDPLSGPGVRAFAMDAPYDKTLVFRRGECKAFHFQLDSSGWRVNDVTEYHLTMELDCSRPNGESIAGRVAIRNCS